MILGLFENSSIFTKNSKHASKTPVIKTSKKLDYVFEYFEDNAHKN